MEDHLRGQRMIGVIYPSVPINGRNCDADVCGRAGPSTHAGALMVNRSHYVGVETKQYRCWHKKGARDNRNYPDQRCFIRKKAARPTAPIARGRLKLDAAPFTAPSANCETQTTVLASWPRDFTALVASATMCVAR